MKHFAHHAWLHIVIISVTIIYVLFGPQMYTHYFVRQGKPIASNVALPPAMTAVQYALDGVEPTSSQGFYLLNGWAFQTTNLDIPVIDYLLQVVLLAESGNHVFRTDSVARNYLQLFYSQYELDVTMSGFSALIYRDSIKPGIYGLGLIFSNVKDQSSFFVSLDQCIHRTPNHLVLEDLSSSVCRVKTKNEGIPIAKNSVVSDRTTPTRMYIETLTELEDHEIYQLSGWAFPIDNKHLPSGSYECKIILSNSRDDYIFAARTIPRFDVQQAFTDLGIDVIESGFTSIISVNELENGLYKMGLIFTHIGDGKEFFVDANRCMTLTEDGLALVAAGIPGCHYPSP